MSLARETQRKADDALEQNQQLLLQDVEVEGGAIAAASSSKRLNNHDNHSYSSSSVLHLPKKHKVEESDEDMFTVPDVEASKTVDNTAAHSGSEFKQSSTTATGIPGRRRRGGDSVDKECRRLKRLLRNRVSAQEARERKTVYVNVLESQAMDLHERNGKLEERISTLINENTVLRKVLLNITPKDDEGNEVKQQDQSTQS